MKIILNLMAGILLLSLAQTCGNSTKEDNKASQTETQQNTMEITGTIEEQGMTSYQYGTHTITTAGDEFYALKSEALDLDQYIGKNVTLIAEKIEGYPLSGGPDYLLVLSVK
ncbi:hypothetical protein [Salinimicrobium oceani]|uniref:NlpE N-terminal domain-containing protein n=1 Tax=Salinimicrobium oceani TaxID=2722702 RepID=A0ABX1D0X5_9FLAO|nr:hypothetical protein [Salinimicrobium oceani]NJW54169.1 hypothetical protein [Salinimicrobium oceani]